MTSPTEHPPRHQLLDALPAAERAHLLAGCEQIMLIAGEPLYTAGEVIGAVYFPLGSVICLKSRKQGQDSMSIGMLGDEGMLGASLLLGRIETPLQALVQNSGPALRMAREPFLRLLKDSPGLQRALRLYLYSLMAQLAQAVACARFHLLLARLARCLLMTRDRTHAVQFHLTHLMLAQMLGVRRVGVTTAATRLQTLGLIHYSRGNIELTNTVGLEDAACGCYAADKASYLRGAG